MIRHIWSVLCARAVIDRTTNNISLFEVIEGGQITTNMQLQFPANVPFEATLVSFWARQDPTKAVTGQMKIRILGPKGEQLIEGTSSIDLQNNGRTRVLSQFNGMRTGGNGVHEFQVSWRIGDKEAWNLVASVPLELTFVVESGGVTETGASVAPVAPALKQ